MEKYRNRNLIEYVPLILGTITFSLILGLVPMSDYIMFAVIGFNLSLLSPDMEYRLKSENSFKFNFYAVIFALIYGLFCFLTAYLIYEIFDLKLN